jgi:tetratricopeptide (TPR) repeat protein
MKRIAYWALPLLLISALATKGLAQEVKWTDNKEYEDYRLVYDEKDLVKKAALAEKFFVDHKNADPIALTQMYTMMLLSYANAGNWAKTLETIERSALGPKLTDEEKKRNTQIGLLAASNLKDNKKIVEYAEKVLKDDPKNLTALIALSGVLFGTVPATNSGPHIARTLDITKQALALPRPAQGYTDPQWNQTQQGLRDTTCLMLLNQQKYSDSIAECQAAIKLNPKDAYAWYWIGLSHRAGFVDLNKSYNDAVKKYNDGRAGPQLEVDELRATMQGAEKVASDKLNEALDAFATAAAIGGAAGDQALAEMKKLFTGTPEELTKLINSKKG